MKGIFSFWTFFGITIWIDIITTLFFLGVKKEVKKPAREMGSISVLIPVHKEDLDNLRNTILSVLREKFPLKKIIICSDPDSRNLSSVIDEFHSYPIEYIESVEKSKAKKINYVISKFGNKLGKYLYVRDCKVISVNNTIEKMAVYFDEENVAAVTTHGLLKKPKNFLGRSYYYGKNWVNEIGRFRKRAQDNRKAVFVVCGASTMYDVDVLKKHPVPSTTKTEDTHYTWDLQFKGFKVKVADDAIVYAPDVEGKYFVGIRSQIKQAYRWSSGTIQCFYYERKSMNKSKKLTYSTLLPGFIEAFTYSVALALLPFLFVFHIVFAIGFLIGDMVFSLLGTLIFIPKKFFHTLFHYPQIAFFKYLNSVIFISAFLVVTYQNLFVGRDKWLNEWVPLK